MDKKAQIAFIIIAAIFIAIVAALVIYAANHFRNKNSAEPLVFEKTSIENYVSSCIKKTAEGSLRLLGRQGIIVLDSYLQAPNSGVEYYIYGSRSRVPPIEKLQSQLSDYLSLNINACLRDFEDFRSQGWDVEKGSANSKVQINQNDVLFEVELPLKVASQGSQLNFEKFSSLLNVRLKYIYDLAAKIADLNAKIPASVDRTDLGSYDVNVTVFPYKDSMVYDIRDSKSLIMGKPYAFRLALNFG